MSSVEAMQEAVYWIKTHHFASGKAMEIVAALDAAIKAAQPQEAPSHWEAEAKRYAQNADYWRNRCEVAGGSKRFDDPQTAVSAGQPSAIIDERIALAKELEGYAKDRGTVIISSELVREVVRALLSERPGWVRVPREPTIAECFAAGKGPESYAEYKEGGLPNTPEERARFEAYMRGHCWAFKYDEDLKAYDTTMVRMLYGVWRDRGYLALLAAAQEGK